MILDKTGREGMKRSVDIFKYIFISILSLLVSTQYAMAPFAHIPVSDQMWFAYGGLRMVHGGVMYRDFFDHKGPLLYIIQFVGQKIAGCSGVWLIEIVLFAISLYIMWSIAELYTDNRFIICCALVYITFVYARWNFYGNFTEEYALLPISFSLLTFIRYIRQGKISKEYIILTGIFCGCVLCLRPNMIGVWIGMSITILIMLIYRKNYGEIAKLLVLFVLGIVAVLIPIGIYLFVNNAWNDMVSQYLLFNFRYSGSTWSDRIHTVGKFAVEMCWFGIPILCLVWLYCWHKGYEKYEKWGLYGSLLISVVLANWSGRFYVHYYEVLIPLILIICVVCFDTVYKKLILYRLSIARIIMCGTVLILSANGIRMWGYYTYHNIADHADEKKYEDLAVWIQEKVDTDETLYSTIGTTLYFCCERFPTTKYHAFPAVDLDSCRYLVEERNMELIQNPNDYILVGSDENLDSMLDTLLESDYHVEGAYLDYVLYKYNGS